MPHVIVKCYKGRTEEQKKELASRIAKDVQEVLGARMDSISIDIKDVDPKDWDSVYESDIEPNLDTLYKKPHYSNID